MMTLSVVIICHSSLLSPAACQTSFDSDGAVMAPVRTKQQQEKKRPIKQATILHHSSAMSLPVTSLNGVKVYNLSAGRTLPQWLEESKKKKISLRYNQGLR
jgi:hypothetical protein